MDEFFWGGGGGGGADFSQMQILYAYTFSEGKLVILLNIITGYRGTHIPINTYLPPLCNINRFYDPRYFIDECYCSSNVI